jgi:thiol-disulfide isomerase/thioredoxin
MTLIEKAKTIATIVESIHPEEFERVVKHERAIALFMAEWCGPCRDVMENLTANSQLKDFMTSHNIFGVYIDVDDNPRLCNEQNIYSVPHIQIYEGGNRQESIIGVISRTWLIGQLSKHYSL